MSGAFKNTQKSGEQPWAGSFGFSDAAELPVPVDTRTTDVGVAAEWNKGRGLVRVGYDGSFFSNNIPTLVWDNPLRSTDSPTSGPARGRDDAVAEQQPQQRFDLRPVQAAEQRDGDRVHLARQPVPGRRADSVHDQQRASRRRRSRARPPTPARGIVATAFAYTTRPTRDLWFSARFRSYDFDNNTPSFDATNTVKYDTTLATIDESSSPFQFSRRTLDLDSSWTPTTLAAFRAAYSLEKNDETFRTFDTTTQNTLRLSVDSAAVHGVTLRGVYEYSKRTGSGLDEQSLDDLGEQTSLRQFDISDFTANRFSAIVIARLGSNLSLNGTGFVGNDNRPDTGFGLLTHDVGGVAVRLRLHPERRGVARRVVSIRELLGAPEVAAGQPRRGVRGSDPRLDDRQRRSHAHADGVSGSAEALATRPTSASPMTSCMASRSMSTGWRRIPRCRRCRSCRRSPTSETA